MTRVVCGFCLATTALIKWMTIDAMYRFSVWTVKPTLTIGTKLRFDLSILNVLMCSLTCYLWEDPKERTK